MQAHSTRMFTINRTADVAHTGTLTYSNTSASQHTVRCSCCDGYIREAHYYDYNSNNQLECIFCGRGDNILGFDEEEIN